ncbi:uncharacterized protein LOC126656120 [Mercurialis annua]|uniref:uncharacterized protein LOC126656120 n=1 Tax=Mercurialis annua TaxID=3986 RepID=UPI002160C368|nr:uncharacterized protein LOC126656120 [Mercurialis annua]
MKNLYNKKGKVHPSPPPLSDHYLSLLPTTILTFSAALSDEDKLVLAYLISCSCTSAATTVDRRRRPKTTETNDDHDPMFECNCFSCYMSFWVRWDASPNRETIHEIIEAYEDSLFNKKNKGLRKKKGKKGKRVLHEFNDTRSSLQTDFEVSKVSESESEMNSSNQSKEIAEVELEKSTVRKITSFLGEKVWGIWSRD